MWRLNPVSLWGARGDLTCCCWQAGLCCVETVALPQDRAAPIPQHTQAPTESHHIPSRLQGHCCLSLLRASQRGDRLIQNGLRCTVGLHTHMPLGFYGFAPSLGFLQKAAGAASMALRSVGYRYHPPPPHASHNSSQGKLPTLICMKTTQNNQRKLRFLRQQHTCTLSANLCCLHDKHKPMTLCKLKDMHISLQRHSSHLRQK